MGLVTRQFGPNAKGKKLTIKEMDDNLLYLESIAFSNIIEFNPIEIQASQTLSTLTSGFIIVTAIPSGGLTITLPTPTVNEDGRLIIIKDSVGTAATDPITVDTLSGAADIDGSPSYVINTNYGSLRIVAYGTNYHIV
jgi:hypothetical protein